MLKKLKLWIALLFWLTITTLGVVSYAQNFYYDYEPTQAGEDTIDMWKLIKEKWVRDQTSIVYKLREKLKLTGGVYSQSDDKALDYIKMIINIALWLVSFISLLLIIYALYLMFFSQAEEALTRAKKIFVWVMIALWVMGVSYFITTFIFFIYEKTTSTQEIWQTPTQQTTNKNIPTNQVKSQTKK